MIRKAVGAIVYQDDKFLLVGKVKLMSMSDGPVDIPLEWHIPGGGVLDRDESNLEALERELREETGSSQFRIVKEYDSKVCFKFPKQISDATGFTGQETVMFLVEYIGSGDDLSPTDEEICRLEFVSKVELFKRIHGTETREFIKNNLR